MPVTNRSVLSDPLTFLCWIQMVIQTIAFEYYSLNTGHWTQDNAANQYYYERVWSVWNWMFACICDSPTILGFVFICICFSINENSFKIKIRVDFRGKKNSIIRLLIQLKRNTKKFNFDLIRMSPGCFHWMEHIICLTSTLKLSIGYEWLN